jgi:hypothetical protein
MFLKTSRARRSSLARAWIDQPRPALPFCKLERDIMVLLLIIVLVLVFLGGGGYYGRRAGWGARNYGLGLVLTVLIIIALVWALNEVLMPPVSMPMQTPTIMR